MQIIAGLFYIIGLGLAGYAGYTELPWYYIIIAAIVMVFGYICVRFSQIYSTLKQDGIIGFIKLPIFLVGGNSIITAIIYFLLSFFN